MTGLEPSSIFKRTFALIGAHWVRMLVPALLLVVLPSVALAYATRAYMPTDPGTWQFWALQAANPAVVAIQYVFGGWVASLAVDEVDASGRGRSAFAKLGIAIAYLWSIIPASFALYLGMWLGLILLIVPGIIFGLAACVAMQALVVERLNPVRAISRSFELTRGRRGSLLWLILLLFVPLTVTNVLGTEIISGWEPIVAATSHPNVVLFWQPSIYFLTGILQYAFFAVIYVELAGGAKLKASAAVLAEFD